MTVLRSLGAAALLAGLARAAGVKPGQIKNLITFGDSYTDIVSVYDGGVAWPVYAAGYAGLKLQSFAHAGAPCSNNITNLPFPSLFETELPQFDADLSNGSLTVQADSTLFTLWIGTNDVGANALLTSKGTLPGGSTIVDTTTCALDFVKALYARGARNFVFQNMIPLELVPMYAPDSYPDRYWKLDRNATEWNLFMTQLVAAGNGLAKLMLESLAPTLKDAHIALFDSHSLFKDMYSNPSQYLNGTVPYNVTGCINSCVFSIGGATNSCTIVNESSVRDSYLWYDELHPSEQADRVVARQIADVAAGKANKWTTWLS